MRGINKRIVLLDMSGLITTVPPNTALHRTPAAAPPSPVSFQTLGGRALMLAGVLFIAARGQAAAGAPSGADLSVSVVAPATAMPGANLAITIVVTNGGPSSALDVTLTTFASEPFVSETQTSGPTASCTTPAVGGLGPISCAITSMPADSAAVFEVVVSIPADIRPNFRLGFSATVSSTTFDADLSNNSASAFSVVQAVAVPELDNRGFVLLAVSLAIVGALLAARPRSS